MPRRDDEELDDYDPEAPDQSDMDDSDEPDFVACPECGKSVSEDAEHCHSCGCHLENATLLRSRPTWAIMAGIALLVLFVFLAVRGVL